MKLLDANQVKTESSKKESDRALHLQKLREEEVAIVVRLNQAHADEEKEKGEIRERIATVRNEAQTAITEIELTVVPLRKEVKDLESRKAEALKPIDEIKKQTDDRVTAVTQRENELEAARTALAQDGENLAELLEDVTDRKESALEKDRELAQRERAVAEEEERSKQSSKQLAQKWVKFHKEVTDANASIAIREKDVENGKKANADYKVELDRQSSEQKEKERELKDRYDTLTRAINEARSKHNVTL